MPAAREDESHLGHRARADQFSGHALATATSLGPPVAESVDQRLTFSARGTSSHQLSKVDLTDQQAHDLDVTARGPALRSADLLAARDHPHPLTREGGRPPLALPRRRRRRPQAGDAGGPAGAEGAPAHPTNNPEGSTWARSSRYEHWAPRPRGSAPVLWPLWIVVAERPGTKDRRPAPGDPPFRSSVPGSPQQALRRTQGSRQAGGDAR